MTGSSVYMDLAVSQRLDLGLPGKLSGQCQHLKGWHCLL